MSNLNDPKHLERFIPARYLPKQPTTESTITNLTNLRDKLRLEILLLQSSALSNAQIRKLRQALEKAEQETQRLIEELETQHDH